MATVNSNATDGVFRRGQEWERAPGRGASHRTRRTELELVAEVLLCLDRGVTQTSAILRRANLPHPRLSAILSELEAKGLAVRQTENGRTCYQIQPKGREFLTEFLSFRSLLERTYGFSL